MVQIQLRYAQVPIIIAGPAGGVIGADKTFLVIAFEVDAFGVGPSLPAAIELLGKIEPRIVHVSDLGIELEFQLVALDDIAVTIQHHIAAGDGGVTSILILDAIGVQCQSLLAQGHVPSRGDTLV